MPDDARFSFDPAPAPNAETNALTMADLIDLVEADTGLDPVRRRNLASSVRRFCAVLGYAPNEATAAFWFFRERIKTFAPAAEGMTRKRWQTIKSDVGAALRHAGVSPKAPKPRRDYAPEWRALKDALAAAGRVGWGLSRLARYAEARGIAPTDVDDLVMAGFHETIRRESFKTNPDHHHRSTCRLWNDTADLLPHLELRKVTLPNYRERYTPDWDALPESFRAEAEAWLTRMSEEGDLLDERAPARPLRPASIKTYRYILRQIAAGFVGSGRPITSITSLACIVEVDAAKAILKWRLDRNGGETSSAIASIAHVLVLVAETAVGADPAEVARLRSIRRRLAVPHRGMRPRPKATLRPLAEPRNIEQILMLPERILAELRKKRTLTRRDALRMQSAVMLELLLMRPIRRKNLAALRLGVHVIRTGGVTRIVIEAEDVKNGIDLEYPLPKESADLLAYYVEKLLPMLGPNPEGFLFPGARPGRSKSGEQLARQFTKLILEETGIHLYPHVMRHFAASLYLRDRPGEYETVRRVLAHKSLTTTTRSYIGMEDEAAVRRYDEHVLGIRATIRRKIGDD